MNPMDSEPVIEISGLKKQFSEITAVNKLDLTIHRGEMFGLVGPDGAGKTTTFRMLCGIISPTTGSIRILGLDVARDVKKIVKQIGYLSQRFSLYGDLTVDENIEFFAKINDVGDYKSQRDELLEFTRLMPFRKRLAEQLSGGMKQKLALACTLIHHPKILFLDEPTTGVDPVSRRDFWKILSNILKEGITIVMSTPYLDEAERCSRVGLMDKGDVMVVDTPQNLKDRLKGNVVEIICEEVRKTAEKLKKYRDVADVQIFGDRLHVVVDDVEKDLPLLRKYIQDERIEITEWRTVNASLENVFIRLLSGKSSGGEM
jgi:drug efflux transport system ATP-binding protein